MPDALSSNSGLGMNVAVIPFLRATFLTTYLYIIRLSAMRVRVGEGIVVSGRPAGGTLGWWGLAGIAGAFIGSTHSPAKSLMLAAGGAGKYPSFWRGLWPRFGASFVPVFQ